MIARHYGKLQLLRAALVCALAASGCGADSLPASESGTTDQSGSGTVGGGFVFVEAPASVFVPVDRLGMPAVGTALITSKTEYNASTPDGDADFVPEIVAAVEGFHAALDDDLMSAGLTPCVPADCVAAAAPLVVPDVIHIDATATAGFPNGRRPADPVMDVVLALLLLDLQVHDLGTLADLPLNPTANDVAFSVEFPYLAPAHE